MKIKQTDERLESSKSTADLINNQNEIISEENVEHDICNPVNIKSQHMLVVFDIYEIFAEDLQNIFKTTTD